MPENAIPPDVCTFILAHIDSIGAIEALLLLRRNQDQSWTSDNVGKRLYISEAEAREVLNQLHEDGLIQNDGNAFRYQMLESGREDLMQRLTDIYQTQLVAVTKVIHAKPRRIREFANAFKLRKDRG
jgi:predicted ArsR family transcriptional regulator